MVEEQSNNGDEVDLKDDTHTSITKEGSLQSQVSQRKRKRNDEDRIILALHRMIDEFG